MKSGELLHYLTQLDHFQINTGKSEFKARISNVNFRSLRHVFNMGKFGLRIISSIFWKFALETVPAPIFTQEFVPGIYFVF